MRSVAGNDNGVDSVFFQLTACGIQGKGRIYTAVKQVLCAIGNLRVLFNRNFDVFLIVLGRRCFPLRGEGGNFSLKADVSS